MFRIFVSSFLMVSLFSQLPATGYAFFSPQHTIDSDELEQILPAELFSLTTEEDGAIASATPLRFLSGMQNSDQQLQLLLQQVARLQAILNVMLAVPNQHYSFPSSGLTLKYYSDETLTFAGTTDSAFDIFSESWTITWPGLQTEGGTMIVLPASDEILIAFLELGMSTGLLDIKETYNRNFTELQGTFSTTIQDFKIGTVDFKNYQLLASGQPLIGFISAKRKIDDKLYYVVFPSSNIVAMQDQLGIYSNDDVIKTIYTLMTNISN